MAIKKSDTLVNCQLSTVNCQLWPYHTPQQHPGMFPGGLHTLSGSQYLGKYYFLQFSKGHFFFSLRICVNFMTFHDKSFLSWNFEWKCKKKLFQTFLKLSWRPPDILSWKFKITISRHLSPVTCHHVSSGPDMSQSDVACEIQGNFYSALFAKKIIKPVPLDQFSIFQWILAG